jgi:thiamine transporter
MTRSRLIVLVEIALSVALAAALRPLAIQMPFGGSVSLDMLPLVVLALRRGVGPGVVAGVLFSFFDYLIEPFFVHWVQVALDYPVAYGLVGLAGLARPLVLRGRAGGEERGTRSGVGLEAAGAVLGTVIGGAARFCAHFVSGVVFFGANAPEGQPVWLYSLVYNATYLLPSVVACGILAAVIVPVLDRAVPVEAR